jgi:hypothetical protein
MIDNTNLESSEEINTLDATKKQVQLIRENSMKKELLEGELLRVVYKGIDVIEELILRAFIFLDISLLEELPNNNSIIYNSFDLKENLISMLDFDFSKIKTKVNPPLIIKSGKCKFCYPNNKTYGFYSTESDELIFRCVIDKVDEENYIVMVCENKSKVKLKPSKKGIPF